MKPHPTPVSVAGQTVFVSFSAGIAMAPSNGNHVDDMMKACDLALHEAKETGHGAWRFFDAEMDRNMQSRRQIEADLESAIKNDEFQVNYQPILSAETRTITGMEALIRWIHPEHGFVPPDQFISVAEASGAIVRIGQWVLNQACRDALTWPEGTMVSINASPVQFTNGNILLAVSEALEKTKLPPERLELEITESIFLNRSAEILDSLHALRDMGVRIVMDDFGIGYSSLSYLRSFPFDKLKLDKSFVLDSDSNEEARVIIEAVSGLGRSLGMATCAEGVETEAHFERIRAAGYTHVQGYLFGRPQPLQEISFGTYSPTEASPLEASQT